VLHIVSSILVNKKASIGKEKTGDLAGLLFYILFSWQGISTRYKLERDRLIGHIIDTRENFHLNLTRYIREVEDLKAFRKKRQN
jgi:hypothetical protein